MFDEILCWLMTVFFVILGVVLLYPFFFLSLEINQDPEGFLLAWIAIINSLIFFPPFKLPTFVKLMSLGLTIFILNY